MYCTSIRRHVRRVFTESRDRRKQPFCIILKKLMYILIFNTKYASRQPASVYTVTWMPGLEINYEAKMPFSCILSYTINTCLQKRVTDVGYHVYMVVYL